MKIKKYTGKTQQEVMKKIREDLGSGAVILNSRQIKKKGLLGLFSAPSFEVTVAIKEEQDIVQNYGRVPETPPRAVETPIRNDIPNQRQVEINNIEEKLEKKLESKLEKKFDKIEEMLNTIADKNAENTSKDDLGNSIVGKEYQLYYNNLIRNGVEPEIVEKIIDWTKEVIHNGSNQSISNLIYNRLIFLLGKAKIIDNEIEKKPQVILFVGPTGVGKTTTIAKLASKFIIKDNKKVGFITADTYRIAAVEQLKTYSDILGSQIKVVYDDKDIINAVDELKDNDYVFVDTAGRSHKNVEHMNELKKLLETFKPDNTFLVMNVSTNPLDAKQIISAYNFLDDYNIIFTKADETSVIGLILNMRIYTKKSLSYITVGQNVPEDISIVDAESIARKLLGSNS